MAGLAHWLQQHTDILIQSAVAELSPDEALRVTLHGSITSFFGALNWAAETQSSTLLHAILINWVELRSVLSDVGQNEDRQSGLLPILATLKRVTWQKIRDTEPAAQGVDLLIELEAIFTDASNYVAKLESDALLANAARELVQTQETVKRLDKSKSDFIAVAAHELKTPLTLIEGYTNMLRSEYKDQENPRAALMLGGIAGGTTRLREIVEDMIDVSMIDMKLLNLHFQPVWLNRMVDIVGFDLGAAMLQRNIKFTVNCPDLSDKPTYAESGAFVPGVSQSDLERDQIHARRGYNHRHVARTAGLHRLTGH